MMTPADEMEQIIREIATHEIDVIDPKYFYSIKSFPEIFLRKCTFYYKVEILEDYRQNDDVNKRCEELRDEIESRKITIKNQIVYTDRKILFHGKVEQIFVPIYYENCVFTSSYVLLGPDCENCIIVGGYGT